MKKNVQAALAIFGKSNRKGLVMAAAAGAMALATSPAFAQISKVNTVMQNIQTVLVGVAVTCFTIALMWAGFKMAFQHAKWSEISNIVIGGIIVGGAAGIAAWLIN
ncbi:TrbC/VirB2 family protein [Variovorax guangxiensis]|nr:TrbC/VirB2 family protein [Variovorax guangxiensis]